MNANIECAPAGNTWMPTSSLPNPRQVLSIVASVLSSTCTRRPFSSICHLARLCPNQVWGQLMVAFHPRSLATLQGTVSVTGVTAQGYYFLCPFLVFKGKPGARIETTEFPTLPPDSHDGCQERTWIDKCVMWMWVCFVLKPHVEVVPGNIQPVILLDSYRCLMPKRHQVIPSVTQCAAIVIAVSSMFDSCRLYQEYILLAEQGVGTCRWVSALSVSEEQFQGQRRCHSRDVFCKNDLDCSLWCRLFQLAHRLDDERDTADMMSSHMETIYLKRGIQLPTQMYVTLNMIRAKPKCVLNSAKGYKTELRSGITVWTNMKACNWYKYGLLSFHGILIRSTTLHHLTEFYE